MKRIYLVLSAVAALMLAVGASVAMAAPYAGHGGSTAAALVRQATAQFKDVAAAQAAGYGLFHGCVSGPQEGAMGVHFANGDLVGDGLVDATRPEALLYEPRAGGMQLVGVEYIVLAQDWDIAQKGPPMIAGQVFNYVGAPNRYGLPAFYELHVWAWRNNPAGTFSDWNKAVSCDAFTGAGMEMGHH